MTSEEQIQHLQQRNQALEDLVKTLQAKERTVAQTDRLAWAIAYSLVNTAFPTEINAALTQQSETLMLTQAKVQTALEELKIVEEELRQQNEELTKARYQADQERQRYQTLFDFAPDGYLVTDTQGIIREANRAIGEKLGREIPVLMGKPLSLLIAPAELKAFHTQLNQLTRTAACQAVVPPQLWQFTLVPQQGDPFFASLRVAFRQESESEAGSLLWLICDITPLKQAEAALRQSEEKFRVIFEQSAFGITISDLEGHFLNTNLALQTMLGYSETELRSLHFTECTHPDDRAEDLNLFQSLVVGQIDSYQLEKRYCRKDGQIFWGRLTISLIRDSSGLPLFYLAIIEDITVAKHQEAERNQFEAWLKQTNQELGNKVEAQSIELKEVNVQIQAEALSREAAEVSLRFSEERYRSVVSALHEGLILVDTKGVIQACNSSAERLLGISATEVLQRATIPLRSFVDEAGSPIATSSLPVSLTLQTGKPCFDVVMGIPQPDRTIRWMLVNTRPLFHPDATQPYAVIASFSDITQRKVAEAELQLQHWRSQLFADIALKIRQSLQPDEVLQTTVTEVRQLLKADRVLAYRLLPDGRGIVSTESTAPPWESLLGVVYEPNVFPKQNYPPYSEGKIRAIEDIEADELAPFCTDFLRAIGVRSKLVVPIIVQDELWGLLIAHQCAAPRHWSSFEIDLLKQLADQVSIALAQSHLLAALRESEERFRTLANSAPVLLWMCDRQQRNTFFNQGWLTFTGQSLEEAMSRDRQMLIHPDDRQEWSDRYRAAFQTQQPFQCEYRMRRVDGEYRWLLDTGIPCWRNNNFEGLIGSCIDISERKKVEDEHRQAEEKTQAALAQERELRELKSRFVSTTSHEFRTPLSTILSSADLLEFYAGRGIAEKQQEHIERIQTAALLMTQLLNDVLTIEQAEAGRLRFEPAPIDLPQFLRNLVAELELNDHHQHYFVLDLCSEDAVYSQLSQSAWMDEKLLRLIFANVLFNAIKYSPPQSTIRLTLTYCDRRATVTIQDEGIGIPKADQSRLFEAFHRATNVSTIPGTGLGLTIVKRSVAAHHGEIAIVSEEGQGTTVTITLPLRVVG